MTSADRRESRVPAYWQALPWAELTAKYGSPLFVFSATAITEQFRRYREAFAQHWPRTRWAWSYKTNYLPAICRLFHAAGAGAEVVSAMEFELAEALQVPGEQIVFNGPHKPRDVLRRAVATGALVNVDHAAEIDDLAAIAEELGRTLNIGLRLNLNPADSPWARFGFDLANGQALQAAEQIARRPGLQLTMLHTHLGTMIPKPGRYGSAVRRMGEFAKELRQRGLGRIETLDLGGGFPSSILPLDGDDTWTPAAIEHYARDIATALKASFPADEAPTLLLEAGRSLIDDAAVMVATVIGEKRLPAGRTGYLLDAGINVLPLATKQRFHVLTLGATAGESRLSSLFGPLCLPTDCLADEVDLPHLSRGSQTLFWPVGAYNVTMMSPFIDYRPAVILLDSGNLPHVIRHRDRLGDVVPKYLE